MPSSNSTPPVDARTISLPTVTTGRGLSKLLTSRRSVKRYTDVALSLDEVACLLAAVAGRDSPGHRVVPSARASYPVSVTVIATRVRGLATGSYRYDPDHSGLHQVPACDQRLLLADTTLDAQWLADCPVTVVLSANLTAARSRFPDQPAEHGERFVWLEAGCMTQNAYLWAAESDRGTVLIAGLDDRLAQVAAAQFLPAGHSMLGLLPVGHPAR